MPSVTAVILQLITLLLFASPAFGQQGEAASGVSRVERLHREFDFQTFAEHKAAAQAIDLNDVDFALLSASVFHATNRRRAEHDLDALRFRPELRKAARIQAQGMAESGKIAHEHPDEALRTPMDRLQQVGLQPAFNAENVAMAFGLQYESGKPFVTREEDGRTVFSYEPGGEPIDPHTYLSFGESLLHQWMDSPGHRKNILREQPEELGTGHVQGTNAAGMDVFYSAQVFFTELEAPPGAEVVPVESD